MKWFFLLPFIGAVVARLKYRRWQVWTIWGGICLFTFLIIWLFDHLPANQVILIVVAASAVGFVAPELWEALRAFLRKPRNIGWILLFGSSIYILFRPQLLGNLLTSGITALGLWIIIRPLFRKRKI